MDASKFVTGSKPISTASIEQRQEMVWRLLRMYDAMTDGRTPTEVRQNNDAIFQEMWKPLGLRFDRVDDDVKIAQIQGWMSTAGFKVEEL